MSDYHYFTCPANPSKIGPLQRCNCPTNRPNTPREIEQHDAMMAHLNGGGRTKCATCDGRGWVS